MYFMDHIVLYWYHCLYCIDTVVVGKVLRWLLRV